MTQKSISIVCPTLNEVNNVEAIYSKISKIVSYEWELIFVDDNSQDGTRKKVESLSKKDRRVRLINRVGRKGAAISQRAMIGDELDPVTARLQDGGQRFSGEQMPARAARSQENRACHDALTGREISARGRRLVTAIRKPMPMPSEIIDDPP